MKRLSNDEDILEINGLVSRKEVEIKKVVNTCPGPFTECVDKTGEKCCSLISEACSELKCLIRAPGQMMLRNFDLNRVYVVVNDNGIVTKAPSRG